MAAMTIRLGVGLRTAAAVLATSLLALASDAHAASRWSRERNTAPSISGAPGAFVTAGGTYRFTPSVTDDDGPDLMFRIRSKPSWASFDAGTGTLSGQPGKGDIGTYSNIAILVSDGIESAALPSFSIEVIAPAESVANSAPSISGVPSGAVTTGQLYAFVPTASDGDNDPLTFSARNVPAWAYFDALSGKLYGTPGATAVGTYSNITIAVSDGKASATLPAFSIDVVEPANVAPKISGTPADVAAVGEPYAFRPTASDANGDTLTFSIQNKPSWAGFDSRTGKLAGTPASGDTGNDTNISISVSDGTLTARLPAFDVTVMPEQKGSASLSWQAPTSNADGTPIEQLSGYKVFYGSASRQYTNSIPLADPALTSVTIEQLEPATWYFAVKAIASSGIESDYSSEVSKLVQ
jgi:hypothetical protein